jgi:hypothetical protein
VRSTLLGRVGIFVTGAVHPEPDSETVSVAHRRPGHRGVLARAWLRLERTRAESGGVVNTMQRFQALQVELVRAGFATEFLARPAGRNADEAMLTMFVDLKDHNAEHIESLDALAGLHGFSYTVRDDSRAALTPVEDASRH